MGDYVKKEDSPIDMFAQQSLLISENNKSMDNRSNFELATDSRYISVISEILKMFDNKVDFSEHSKDSKDFKIKDPSNNVVEEKMHLNVANPQRCDVKSPCGA